MKRAGLTKKEQFIMKSPENAKLVTLLFRAMPHGVQAAFARKCCPNDPNLPSMWKKGNTKPRLEDLPVYSAAAAKILGFKPQKVLKAWMKAYDIDTGIFSTVAKIKESALTSDERLLARIKLKRAAMVRRRLGLEKR